MKEPKSYWNYRIVATYHPNENPILAGWNFSIRDVYYKNGKPTGWGAEPQPPQGEDSDSVFGDLCQMQNAVNLPLLIEQGDKLVEYPKKTALVLQSKHLKEYEPK